MFDAETVNLLNTLPQIGDITASAIQTRLTSAYLETIRLRLEQPGEEIVSMGVVNQLRQLINSLEMYCLVEFFREGRLTDGCRAAALSAAQSLEFLTTLSSDNNDHVSYRHILANPRIFAHLEAGLLYLIGGYYANARALAIEPIDVAPVPQDTYTLRQAIAEDVLAQLNGLLTLSPAVRTIPDLSWLIDQKDPPEALSPSDLSISIEGKLLLEVAHSIRLYLTYLSGESRQAANDAMTLIREVRQRVANAVSVTSMSRAPAEALLPHHLASLLEVLISGTQELALSWSLEPPPGVSDFYHSAFVDWVNSKASHGYALLWPSTQEWLRWREQGAIHTVVSMPTGSGKSFLGEIILAQRLEAGWGLYLAPTNALVRQIRRDLKQQMAALDVKVQSFLTDEYTTLIDENFTGAAIRTVVVMTPDKAALAIRLRPDAFHNCSVVVFDECHLLAKERRGATSDDLMGRLLLASPDIHVLLMSAMVENSQQLADWLTAATGQLAKPVKFSWKPTRNLRSLTIFSDESLAEIAWNNNQANCPVQLVGCSETSWKLIDDNLVKIDLPIVASIRRKTDERGVVFYNWVQSVNVGARQIAVPLVNGGTSTLLFISTSPYHVWTHAQQAAGEVTWNAPEKSLEFEPVVEAWLELARSELGIASPLSKYHSNGITVHSGALIDEERHAAEIAYSKELVGLMIATGTLSQGLNFPTQIVVMAGIEGGYTFAPGPEDILNSLGRSGRAGFSNVGASILVSKPIVRQASIAQIQRTAGGYLSLLQKDDACFNLRSSLTAVTDRVIQAADNIANRPISTEDLAAATIVFDLGVAASHFSRTYAAFLAEMGVDYAIQVRAAANTLITSYVHATGCPEWLPSLAQQAGLSVKLMNEMRLAIEGEDLKSVLTFADTFDSALDLLEKVVVAIQLDSIQLAFGPIENAKLRGLPKCIGETALKWEEGTFEDQAKWVSQWKVVFEMIERWMRGQTYADVAKDLFGATSMTLKSRSDKSPIKFAIVGIRDLIYPLAHVASGLILLVQQLLIDRGVINQGESLPWATGMLPQAIHWGVDSLEKALWYHELLPVRQVAHAVAKVLPFAYQDDNSLLHDVRTYAGYIRTGKISLVDLAEQNPDVGTTLKAAAAILGYQNR